MFIIVSENDCSPDAVQIILLFCYIKLLPDDATFIHIGNAFQMKNCLYVELDENRGN